MVFTAIRPSRVSTRAQRPSLSNTIRFRLYATGMSFSMDNASFTSRQFSSRVRTTAQNCRPVTAGLRISGRGPTGKPLELSVTVRPISLMPSSRPIPSTLVPICVYFPLMQVFMTVKSSASSLNS